MTFREIMLELGKTIELEVFYTYVDEQSVLHQITLKNDDIVKIRQYFNARITGSIMQCAEIELFEQIPDNKVIDVTIKGTYGTYTASKTITYRVKDSTYNADTKTYTHNCCDFLLDWMVEYEPLSNVTYPCTIQTFFTKLCNIKGYSTNITLPNQNQQLDHDIYEGIGMSYRDVLDDICAANGICVEKYNFQIIKRDFGTTPYTIDDDSLMNNNISVNEHYGPVNVITMNRTGYDAAYYPTTLPQTIHDYVIQDNQTLNGDDRLDYAQGIFGQLEDLEFDTYDLQIVGCGGFEPLEQITITTDGKTFNSYVFNDEVVYEGGGISETIYCDYPTQAHTDYQYATPDKQQDREAKIIVDKLNQELSLEGKTINLTADDIKIDSTYFKVDKNGNLIANSLSSNNATITGGGISIPSGYGMTADISSQGIMVYKTNDPSTQYAYLSAFQEGQLKYGYFTLTMEGGAGVTLTGYGSIECNQLIANNIKCGQSCTNGGNDTWVSFGHTFSSAPYVVCTPVMQSAGVGNYSLNVWGITTTGFYVYHSGNNGAYVTFNWIAMN